MKINLKWATPVVIGSFLLSAVTGILMFFHIDISLNKLAHEWMSWVLVGGVVLHVLNNLFAFKRYFGQTQARWLMGALVLVLAGSFLPLGSSGGGGEPPQATVLKTMAGAPVSALAAVAGVPVPAMRQRLADAGVAVADDTQSVKALVGPDRKRQMQVLAQVLAPAAPKTPG